MAKTKKYTKEELAKITDQTKLRAIAKKLGIKIAGKRPADLRREILKAQKAAEGKGTAADPKSGKGKGKGKKKDDEDDEDDEEESDDEDEEEDDAEESDEDDESEEDDDGDGDDAEDDEEEDEEGEEAGVSASSLAAVIGLVIEIAKKVKVKVPKEVTSALKETEDSDEEDDAEEEDDEEEEEADEDEEESDEDEEESDDEDEDEEEDGEQVDLSPDTIAEMNIARLKEVAKALNEENDAGITIVSDPKKMRTALLKYVAKHAEDAEDEDEDDDDGKDDKSFIKEGATVLAHVDGDWYDGEVQKVNAKKKIATCYFDVDETTADVAFKDIRKKDKKAKKGKKK